MLLTSWGDQDQRRISKSFFVVGYGIPLSLVSVVCLSNPKRRNLGTTDMFWLSREKVRDPGTNRLKGFCRFFLGDNKLK